MPHRQEKSEKEEGVRGAGGSEKESDGERQREAEGLRRERPDDLDKYVNKTIFSRIFATTKDPVRATPKSRCHRQSHLFLSKATGCSYNIRFIGKHIIRKTKSTFFFRQ